MRPQLCLGTAQFGQPYGITNAIGQVSEEAVSQLLAQAEASGICFVDTAQAYGNAEVVLGRHLPVTHQFRLISKLPAQPQGMFTAQDALSWELDLFSSCQRLGVKRLDSFLLHSAADLRKPGAQHLEEWLMSLRNRGFVQRLGISIYDADDLYGVNPELLDLVQLPLSLLDQRLLEDGTIARLRSRGTAIHARSLYLQGLLLTPADQWPGWVAADVRAHQQALQAFAKERGCRLIDLALGFASEQTDLEAVVVGLCSVQELAELREAWTVASPWQNREWQVWALKNPVILDPRCWPSI